MDKQELIKYLADDISNVSEIISARAYGSWFHDVNSVDIDIAVVVPSVDGIVNPEVYTNLKDTRSKLAAKWNADIDLVPHTVDEFDDLRSPLWYPRYNPSLIFGQTLKGDFLLSSVHDKHVAFGFREMTAYVLLDNRTICRRQLVRTLEGETGRIYISKLLHGPGNALTYHSCQAELPYLCSPSDLIMSQKIFDEIFKVNSKDVLLCFLRAKPKQLTFGMALKLMEWYERLLSLVFSGESHAVSYEEVCSRISREA